MTMWTSIGRRLIRGEVRFVHAADWNDWADGDTPDDVFTWPMTDDCHSKQGRSTGRRLFANQSQSRAAYIKRHYRYPLWRRLAACIWPEAVPSHGWTEWNNLQWAKAHGIAVPRPLAAAEFIGPGLQVRSFLVLEELTGMIPLHRAIPQAHARLAPRDFSAWKSAVVADLATTVARLHREQRFHKDLYLCHFFVPADSIASATYDRDSLHMIDLHRLARHRWTGWWWRIKDLAQLLFSTFGVVGVTDRDRCRFVRHYRRLTGLTPIPRWFVSAVRLKARAYLRHANRREPLSPSGNERFDVPTVRPRNRSPGSRLAGCVKSSETDPT